MNRTLITHLILAFGLLVAAIVFAVGIGVTLDAARIRVADLGKEIANKQLETERQSVERATLPVLESSEAALARYSVYTEDIVPFLSQLEKQGKAQGAVVEVLSVSDGGVNRQRILLSLHITGSFDAVARTLGMIEYGPYDATFTSVTLDTTSEKDAKVAQWSAGAVLSVSAVPTKPILKN